MKIFNSIRFNFKKPEDAQIFYKSFMPEFNDMPMKRAVWKIKAPKKDNSDIIFEIEAKDATAFRATINSLIQFANIVEKTINIVEDKLC